MFIEKRKYQRVDYNLPIKLSDSEFDIVTETKNISASGAYCSVDTEIPTMTKMRIILLIPLKRSTKKHVRRINCEGIVVRNQPVRSNGRHYYDIGIYFNDIKEKDRKAILSYINSVLS